MKRNLDLPEQIRSLSRFPIPAAIATSLAVLLNLQVAHVIHLSDSLENEVIFACLGCRSRPLASIHPAVRQSESEIQPLLAMAV